MIAPPRLPAGSVIFCDDVRYEIGGKRSIMGIYTAEMVIAAEAPFTMPTLCVLFSWKSLASELPKIFRFTLYRDTVSASEELFSTEGDLSDASPPLVGSPNPMDPDAPRIAEMSFEARFGGLEFAEDCHLRVRAILDGVEHRMGSLSVRFASHEGAPVG